MRSRARYALAAAGSPGAAQELRLERGTTGAGPHLRDVEIRAGERFFTALLESGAHFERQDFAPEVKFFAVEGSAFERSAQERAVLMTGEYLVDVFRAAGHAFREHDPDALDDCRM